MGKKTTQDQEVGIDSDPSPFDGSAAVRTDPLPLSHPVPRSLWRGTTDLRRGRRLVGRLPDRALRLAKG